MAVTKREVGCSFNAVSDKWPAETTKVQKLRGGGPYARDKGSKKKTGSTSAPAGLGNSELKNASIRGNYIAIFLIVPYKRNRKDAFEKRRQK